MPTCGVTWRHEPHPPPGTSPHSTPPRPRRLAQHPGGTEEKFAKFTRPGGLAVLKIISSEVARRGACTLTVDTIADLASIDRSVVKVALRTAKAEGLIKV